MKKAAAVRLDIVSGLMLMAVFVQPLDIPNDTTDMDLPQERKSEGHFMEIPETKSDQVDVNHIKSSDNIHTRYLQAQFKTDESSYSDRGNDVTGGYDRSRREVNDVPKENSYESSNNGYSECYLCPAGPAGYAGTPGRPGFKGLMGPRGLKGTQGPLGSVGPPGLPGLPGRDGRDALSGSCGDQTRSSSTTNSGKPKTGVVFTRWGNVTCPHTSQLVYSGMAAGTYFLASGGTSDISCHPDAPQFSFVVGGTQTKRSPTGLVEYATNGIPSAAAVQDESMPCSVCMAIGRTAQMMVPGRNTCPSSEWTLEYSGYLQASKDKKYRTATICLDEAPQGVTALGINEYGAKLTYTELRCGYCGGYTDGFELTCAVCTI